MPIFYEVPPGELFKIKPKNKKQHRHCQNWGKSQPFIQSLCFTLETKTRWYFPCRLNLVIEHLCGEGDSCLALSAFISFTNYKTLLRKKEISLYNTLIKTILHPNNFI